MVQGVDQRFDDGPDFVERHKPSAVVQSVTAKYKLDGPVVTMIDPAWTCVFWVVVRGTEVERLGYFVHFGLNHAPSVSSCFDMPVLPVLAI